MYNQEIHLPILHQKSVQLFIKREDTNHPFISGNKLRKLKYNILKAKTQNNNTLVTFGGAFSNHIAATAYAGFESKMKTIGIIRGEELRTQTDLNPTLSFAKKHGMELEYISRSSYRKKHTPEFIASLKQRLGDFYLVPEGGTNALAIRGCEEILQETDTLFDYITVAVGTGGTISGLINTVQSDQYVLGFPALKGDFLQDEIVQYTKATNWRLITNYNFGGYAKINTALIAFINDFKKDTGVLLDPIYTGKMLYGIVDMIKKNKFEKGSKILAIHTGGLQGIAGMNQYLTKKQLPILK